MSFQELTSPELLERFRAALDELVDAVPEDRRIDVFFAAQVVDTIAHAWQGGCAHIAETSGNKKSWRHYV